MPQQGGFMRYIIVEDERFAQEEMKRMMQKLRPDYSLAGCAGTIKDAVSLLSDPGTDLMILDISLADGLGFEIFGHIRTDIPVIFTTAYDEYAIRAFKVNSVDYLLKPVEEDELESALSKFERHASVRSGSPEFSRLRYHYRNRKNRFLVQSGDSFIHISTEDIAFFYSEDKYVYLHLFSGGRYIVDYSLDHLENVLDRDMFFRVSRNCISNIKAIVKSSRYFGSRLLVHSKPECPHRILVSRSRVPDYLKWIDGSYDSPAV